MYLAVQDSPETIWQELAKHCWSLHREELEDYFLDLANIKEQWSNENLCHRGTKYWDYWTHFTFLCELGRSHMLKLSQVEMAQGGF